MSTDVRRRKKNEFDREQVPMEIVVAAQRLQERFMAEGFPSFTLAEQFAYLIYIRMKRPDTELLPFDLSWIRPGEKDLQTVLDELSRENNAPDFLFGAKLLEEHRLLFEVWNLTSEVIRLCGAQETGKGECRQQGNDVSALQMNIASIKNEEAVRERAALVLDCILDTVRATCRDVFLTPRPLVHAIGAMLDWEQAETFWDPACGTGSFLAEAWSRKGKKGKLSGLSGTELSETMILEARIRRYFNNMPRERTVLVQGNAFSCAGVQYDRIVSNPPVISSAGEGRGDYRPEIATRKVNLQFLQLIMDSLKKGGQAAVIINENVLFSDQATEIAIRKRLVERQGLYAVISLPQGAFAPAATGKMSVLFFGGACKPSVFFYEVEHIGSSRFEKHGDAAESDLPDLLRKWKNRSKLLEKWQAACETSVAVNEYHVEVPGKWKQKNCWFASREAIRRTAYNLAAKIYRPQEKQREVYEAPEQILKTLAELERRTKDKIDELTEIMKDYE